MLVRHAFFRGLSGHPRSSHAGLVEVSMGCPAYRSSSGFPGYSEKEQSKSSADTDPLD